MRTPSTMVTMLKVKLPQVTEAEPVEAVPMTAAREHEVHVTSSKPLQHHAALLGHHVLRTTLAVDAAVRRLCRIVPHLKAPPIFEPCNRLTSGLHQGMANLQSRARLSRADTVRRDGNE